MLTDLTVNAFVLETAKGSPVPGGGSVSALAGALAAALSAMVARLTIGKKGFETSEEQLSRLRDAGDKLRVELLNGVDRDAASYENFLRCLQLPRSTPAEQERRKTELAEAKKDICEVPLAAAQHAIETLELAAGAVTLGRKDIVTDAAVAVLLARAAVRGALLNVRFNLAAFPDKDYVAKTLRRVREMETEVEAKEKEILRETQSRIGDG